MRFRHGTRKCSSCINQKPRARKIRVATNMAFAIIFFFSASGGRGFSEEKRRGAYLSALRASAALATLACIDDNRRTLEPLDPRRVNRIDLVRCRVALPC